MPLLNVWTSCDQHVLRGVQLLKTSAPTSGVVRDKYARYDPRRLLVLNSSWNFSQPQLQKSFTCFPKLPVELQRQIWRDAANLPRFVTISDSETETDQGIYEDYRIIQAIKSPQPAVLQVCQDSRAECMQYFTPIFGGNRYIGSAWYPFNPVPPVYLNPSSDIVYLSARHQSQFHRSSYEQGSKSLGSIETVALDWDDFRNLGSFRIFQWLKGLLVHQHVKTIILTLEYQKVENAEAYLDAELLPVSSDAGRKAAIAATHLLSCAFDHYHEELISRAGARYLMKPRGPFDLPNSGPLLDHQRYWGRNHRVKLDIEENPSQEALEKYAEAIGYVPPQIKIVEFARVGHRRVAH